MAAAKMADVAKPGSTPADSTSKPVIVGHKTLVKDPMVSEDKPAPGKEPAKASGEKRTQERKLQPISEDLVNKAEPEPPVEKPVESTPPETASDSVDIDKPEATLAENSEDPRQAKLKELIANKKYNVNFESASQASAKSFIITVLVVLLIGATLVLLLEDAGVIDLGLSLPFDFIK